jgi:hypothetical protein
MGQLIAFVATAALCCGYNELLVINTPAVFSKDQ